MVILGLLLIIFGVIAILSALFVSEGSGELLGIDMGVLAIFLIGVAAGAAILWGFTILKWGTRRGLAHRSERKQLIKRQREIDKREAKQESSSDTTTGQTPPSGQA